MELKQVVKTIIIPLDDSTKLLSLTPFGIDNPRFLTRKVRYLLLKDEKSVSLLDTETGNYEVIAQADIDAKYSMLLPFLSTLTIKWINSHPEKIFQEPTIERAVIYSTEGAKSIRIINVGTLLPV
jgi:hypothetical protein